MQTISDRQFVFILIVFITSTADLLLPSITTQLAGRDAWLSVIVAAAAGSLIVLVQAKLAQQFPGQSLPDYAKTLLGPTAGSLLILLYLFFLTYITAAIIGELLQISNAVFFRRTPEVMISLMLCLTAGYAVFLGIEVVARVVEFSFVVGILVRLLIIVLVMGDMDLARFLPVLEQGPGPVLQGSLRVLGWFGEGVILLFLSHHLQNPAQFGKLMLTAVWFIAFLLILGTASIAIFGTHQAAVITFPLFEIIRFPEVGFIRGIDALIMTVWYAATFIKITVLLYIIMEILKKLTKSKEGSPFMLPMLLVLTVLPVVLFSEISSTIDFLTNTWPGFAVTFELLFPAALLLLTLFRKQGKKGRA
ncbi:MAG: GerAB/ArcD/ProY family transporter [Bacillota bacterium]